jgi:hypothetical protein
MFFIFLPTIFLSLAFRIQWQKNEGQKNEVGEYQMLLPTAVSKKHVFQCAQKMSFSPSKAASTNAALAEQKATIFVKPSSTGNPKRARGHQLVTRIVREVIIPVPGATCLPPPLPAMQSTCS